MRLRRADVLGTSTIAKVHMLMLNEQGGTEGTYAGVPSTSFTDGFDPAYTKWLEFDLAGSVVPNAHTPKP